MLNYKHLHYFQEVATSGSIARASEKLHLTPQTISGQLGLLEEQLGVRLFHRVGRQLELSENGKLVLRYAKDIFSLGSELEQLLHNLPADRPQVFRVGIADVVPKTITYRLLAPALQQPQAIRIVCREGTVDNLLAELALHKLDLVIADGPIPATVNIRGFSHPLGESGISFFATDNLKQQMQGEFPQNLNAMPLLLPGATTQVRDRLLHWLEEQQIYPRIVGEFDDSALMKAFGQSGTGIFIAPTPIATEVMQQYAVQHIGQTNEVRDAFYAISVERKISHPAVSTITETAREWLS